uniref:Protein kinase domain-containing protein n=1 Tax=Panagrellus redivivus TaxID=6233 RepID=A0A7E4UPQ2_PANRE
MLFYELGTMPSSSDMASLHHRAVSDLDIANSSLSYSNDAPEYHGSDLSALSIKEKQKSEELAARLPPPSVRRHASLAVDNSRRLNTVRNPALKRGSVTMEQIKKVDLDAEYAVYKQLGSGRFGFIKLAEHKQAKKKIAIKFFPRPQIKQSEFVREYNYSYFLSPHPNIIDTYDGMFASNDDSAFFFVQEFCPYASLREAVEAAPNGLTEETTKAIMNGVLSAIEFMHNENLVHRNLKTENVLIFDNKTYSRVKITDFGLTRKIDSTVKHLEYVTNYHAPELCEIVVNEVLTVRDSVDIWALGIIFYYCLKGRFPWQKATIMYKPYWEWEQWLKRKNPALPKRWEPFSEKALKIFKRSLNPKPKDRWSAKDMRKCIMKEKLLKPIKVNSSASCNVAGTSASSSVESHKAQTLRKKSDSPDEYVYYPETTSKDDRLEEPKPQKKRSIISQWINTTLNTMAEISEQVVSARDE